ncbi:MAG: alpha/beta fold hydrolase [Acidimicrobiales bacterium]
MTADLKDRYVDNDGVTIHYMTAGSGPLIVLIHGFPDFWYTWRHQLDTLAETHTVAAVDTRGYNLSDKPALEEHYDMEYLLDDVAAVIANESRQSAVIIGHDWGAVIAWTFAARRPDLTERLVILSIPHLKNIAAVLSQPEHPQTVSLAYIEDFQKPGSEDAFDPAGMASFMSPGNEEVRSRYQAAFEQTSFAAAMNYYRRNTLKRLAEEHADLDPIGVPVLQFHGLDNPAFLPEGLNNTWQHLGASWTLVTIPNAGHWPHHDQPELVTATISDWLAQPHRPQPSTRSTGSSHGSVL